MKTGILLKPTLTACVLILATVGASDAQLANGRWQAPPKSAGGQRGVQPTKPDASVSPTSTVLSPSPQPVAVKLIPAVVMSDGSILADFGFGLEPVRRACSRVVLSTRPIPVIAGNGQVLSHGVPGTQPAPAQVTPSQQNLPSASQRPLSRAALGSCFTRDLSGRAFVIR